METEYQGSGTGPHPSHTLLSHLYYSQLRAVKCLWCEGIHFRLLREACGEGQLPLQRSAVAQPGADTWAAITWLFHVDSAHKNQTRLTALEKSSLPSSQCQAGQEVIPCVWGEVHTPCIMDALCRPGAGGTPLTLAAAGAAHCPSGSFLSLSPCRPGGGSGWKETPWQREVLWLHRRPHAGSFG